MTSQKYREGQLVRFEFANGSAIEGYVRMKNGEPWLDYMTATGASWMGPWFNSPTSPLRGITPTILREPPPLIEPLEIGAVIEDGAGSRWVRVYPPGGPAPWICADYREEVWSVWSAIPEPAHIVGGEGGAS